MTIRLGVAVRTEKTPDLMIGLLQMNRERIKQLLEDTRSGRLSIDEAMDRISSLPPYEDVEFARVDHHRALRHGFPEVVLGQGKTPEQITGIAERILAHHGNLLISRTTDDVFRRIAELAPDAEFHREARMISVLRDRTERGEGVIAVITA